MKADLATRSERNSRLSFLYKPFLAIMIFLLALTATACGAANSPQTNSDLDKTVSVDRVFQEFYRSLGASTILGPAIYKLFDWGQIKCQYTEKTLMCFDPNADNAHRYYLYPLGTTFNIVDPSTEIQSSNGIDVYKEFQPLYKQLKGAENVGRPITEVRFNPLEQRLEQYFENVGFYRLVDDPGGSVHLLAYGVFACKDNCSYPARKGSAVANQPLSIAMPFLPAIAKMDNPAAFGEPLTIPYQLENGQIQQVYENAVFIGNSMQAESVRLLNVPILLGLEVEQPQPQGNSTTSGMVFYNIDGANGFNVPIVFDQFIVGHGGREFSGDPIGEFFEIGENYRQCFQNYCLDYFRDAENGKKVRLVPLGEEYLSKANLPESYIVRFKFTPQTINLQAQVQSPLIKVSQAQTIKITVHRSQDDQPISDVDFTVTVSFPDGSKQDFLTQPSNLLGISQLELPLFPSLKRGRVVAYQVCLNQASDADVCIQNHYLVW